MPDFATTLLVAALSSGGLATIVASIVSARSSKKKLGADATEAIQRAASGVVADLERQYARAVAELDAARKEHREQMLGLAAEHTEAVRQLTVDQAEEREQWKHLLQLHVAWDWMAIEKLATADPPIVLPDPPPILPRAESGA